MSAAMAAVPAAAGNRAVAAEQARWDMIHALGTSGPRIDPAEDPAARLFDRFVGTWDIDYTSIADDGSRDNTKGQLIVGWILDGRAIQDIWIWPEPGHAERWMGTTLRFYDAQRKTWRITWVSPFSRAVTLLEGGGDAQRIVLLGSTPANKLRWTFSDISDHDFRWHGEISRDDGASWKLREEHHMRRVRSPTPAA